MTFSAPTPSTSFRRTRHLRRALRPRRDRRGGVHTPADPARGVRVSTHPKRRGLIKAVVVAAVALVAGTAAVVALWSDSPTPVNGAYGVISCSAPALPGSTVNVQVTDSGDMMTS